MGGSPFANRLNGLGTRNNDRNVGVEYFRSYPVHVLCLRFARLHTGGRNNRTGRPANENGKKHRYRCCNFSSWNIFSFYQRTLRWRWNVPYRPRFFIIHSIHHPTHPVLLLFFSRAPNKVKSILSRFYLYRWISAPAKHCSIPENTKRRRPGVWCFGTGEGDGRKYRRD